MAAKNYFKRNQYANTFILVDFNVLVEGQRVLRRGESARSGIGIKWTISYITSVKLAPELGEITFYTGKPKLTPGEVPTFQVF